MTHIVALGESDQVQGFALAGVRLIATAEPDELVRAWEALPDDVAVVILTRSAHRVLGERLGERPRLLWTVMPT
jgi:vacuolar-type H+-ATPase subunit F/Vma7